MAVWCRSLVTEPGRHTVAQEDLAQAFRERLGGLPDPEGQGRLVGFIAAQSEIRQRYVEAEPRGHAGRADWIGLVNRCTERLARRTLEKLASVDPQGLAEMDALVVVSSSTVGFPSLSRRLQVAPDVVGFDLTGLGCAGPPQAIPVAVGLLKQGYRQVGLVFVDAMATWAQGARFSHVPAVNEMVAHLLASDGAAAMLLSREPGPAPVFCFVDCTLQCRQWPDSLDQNDLTADAQGRPYLSVGKAIRTRIVAETAEMFDEEVVSRPVLMHPGGPDLMRRVAEAVPELAATAERSLGVLRDHGNLGSASALFVLERALRDGVPLAPQFRLFALGPGIVTAMLRFDGVEMA